LAVVIREVTIQQISEQLVQLLEYVVWAEVDMQRLGARDATGEVVVGPATQ
jgi:hypothetical protein